MNVTVWQKVTVIHYHWQYNSARGLLTVMAVCGNNINNCQVINPTKYIGDLWRTNEIVAFLLSRMPYQIWALEDV